MAQEIERNFLVEMNEIEILTKFNCTFRDAEGNRDVSFMQKILD